MRVCNCMFAVSYGLFSSAASASEPKASVETQQKFWALTEQIAIALQGDGDDLMRLISPAALPSGRSSAIATRSRSTEIGPSLFADEINVVKGEGNRTGSVSFDLSGSCIPSSSVRMRYPNLIVINHAAGDLEWNTLGTQVGDSIIAFWFQGEKFGCMRKVDITQASGTLSRLNVN
jgi:hypothetical protein